jgi:hypothetical protein
LRIRVFALVLAAGIAGFARAQDVRDADTLPKNVGGIIIQPALGYGPGVERFGPGWKAGRESLISDFNDIPLSEVLGIDSFPGLGITHFDGSQTSLGINLAAAYGVTDRLTFAVFLPFLYARYRVEAWLSEATEQIRVLSRDRFVCPGGNFRLEDIANNIEYTQPGEDPFNIGDVNRVLVSDCLNYKAILDGAPELQSDGNYHGFGKREYSGFRDLILGAKYKWFHGEDIQLSTITYVIAPTGKVNDPDDLFDFNFGDGQWDAALLGAVTIPLGDFRFAGSVGYEISFGDTEYLRLPTLGFSDDLENELAAGRISEEELFEKHIDSASMVPIVTRYDAADVKRKLGDTFYIYAGFSYQVLEWLSVGVTLDFMHHFRDKLYSMGERPEGTPRYSNEAEVRAAVAQMAADGAYADEQAQLTDLKQRLGDTEARHLAAYGWHTVRGQLVGGLGINFNTLGPFLRDEFPLPLIGGISMSRWIAGQNLDTPDSISLSIILPIPFGDIKDPAEYGFDDQPGRGLPWP